MQAAPSGQAAADPPLSASPAFAPLEDILLDMPAAAARRRGGVVVTEDPENLTADQLLQLATGRCYHCDRAIFTVGVMSMQCPRCLRLYPFPLVVAAMKQVRRG